MKKNIRFLGWTSAAMLTISMSAILSFLFITGPIIAGVALSSFSKNWPLELTSKKLLFNAICLLCGLIGLLFVQVFLFKMSGLPLLINVMCLVVPFVLANLPNKEKEKKIKPKPGFKGPVYPVYKISNKDS